jgi:hypothetical protein
MCSYSCSRRVSLKVVLNLCHKIGFEVAKLPPQTRWRRPQYILSLSPAELRGAKRLGQGRALRARRKAAALPRPARQATNPCRVRGGAAGTSRFPPPAVLQYCSTAVPQYRSTAVHTAVCTTVHTAVHTAVCTAAHTAVCIAGGSLLVPAAPPWNFLFFLFFLNIKICF